MNSSTLESRIATLEKMLLSNGDSIYKDTLQFYKNIERASDLLKESLDYWNEGLILSLAVQNAVKVDLADIITKSNKIMLELK